MGRTFRPCRTPSDMTPSGAGVDPCALTVSAGAGGDASRVDLVDIPRINVFRDRIVQETTWTMTTRSLRYASRRQSLPAARRQFPRLKRHSTPNEKALEHELLAESVMEYDNVRKAARSSGKTVHFGCVPSLCVATNAQRALAGRKKVQRASGIRGFIRLGSDSERRSIRGVGASLMSASKMIDIVGCQQGGTRQLSDTRKADTYPT